MSKKSRNRIVIPNDPPTGPSWLLGVILLFIAPPVSTVAGLYLLYKRGRSEWLRKKYKDYRHYAAVISDRGSVSIAELANRLGKSTTEVADDLQRMINDGIIDSSAYIDRTAMMLYMSDDVVETEFVNPTVNIYVNQNAPRTVEYETARPARAQAPAAPEPEPAPQPAPKKEEIREDHRRKAEVRRTGTDNADFEEKLRQIRELNDEIDNELVSQRIDRIGALTASIFRVVREKPERADEVRKFMNYYLPTTFKLLKSYSLMEKQSYQGENIQASRKKIEDVLETLVHAFEQQQDKLFQSDALDVETDISVLETMMASDGLTRQEGGGLHL